MTFDQLYDEVEALDASISRTKMFGMQVLKVQGKIFAGETPGGGAAFKLPPAEVEKTLALPGAKRFEPMQGRAMKEWVEVPGADEDEWLRLAEVAKAYALERLKRDAKS